MIFNKRNMLLQSSDYPPVLIQISFGLEEGGLFQNIFHLLFSLSDNHVQALALPSRCVSDNVILASVGHFRLILTQRR